MFTIWTEGYQNALEDTYESGLTIYINPDENDDRWIHFSFHTKFVKVSLNDVKDYTAQQFINHMNNNFGVPLRSDTQLKYGNWTLDPDRTLGSIHYFAMM